MSRNEITRAWAIAALAISFLSIPHTASAYCVLPTPNSSRLLWPFPPFAAIPNTIDPTGADLVAPAAVVAAVNAAQFTWNVTPAAPRWTYVLGVAGVGDPFTKDGVNLIGFRDLSIFGYGPNTYGVTALWYVVGGPNDGVITEIGVALNIDPARAWSWASPPLVDNNVDIESIALHHLGHGIGLAHAHVSFPSS